MATSIVRSRTRVAVLGAVSALLAATTLVTPSFAATTTAFNAVYPDEVTTPRTCPAGVPAGAFCYTGVGHGPTTPPGSTGTEQFAGFVDESRANLDTHCAPD